MTAGSKALNLEQPWTFAAFYRACSFSVTDTVGGPNPARHDDSLCFCQQNMASHGFQAVRNGFCPRTALGCDRCCRLLSFRARRPAQPGAEGVGVSLPHAHVFSQVFLVLFILSSSRATFHYGEEANFPRFNSNSRH